MARQVDVRTARRSVTRFIRRAGAAGAAMLACFAGVLCTVAATPASAVAASTGQFRPVPLPPDVGYLNAIACPAARECFVAGQTAGANQHGLVLHLVGGAWQSTVIPAAAYLIGITCTEATDCIAVGVTSDPARVGEGVIVDTFDGSTWHVATLPPSTLANGKPAIPLDSVSCSGSFCMAVGGQFAATSGSAPASQVLVTSGQGWSAATVPVESGATGSFLTAVDCTAPADCWVVGQGVWHTADAGATWVAHDPPNATAADPIALTYSLLSALDFTDPMHGLVAGGDQCGGSTDHCGGSVFKTGNGGVTWTRASNANTPFVQALTCRSGLTACIATSGTFTPLAPGAATANVSDGSVVLASTAGSAWPITQRLKPDNLTAVSCPTSTNCLAVGGDQPHNVGAVLTEVPLPAAPRDLSVVATSLPAPKDAFSGLGRAVVNTTITLAAMLALTFPSQLFNRTFEENYDEILAITKRRFGRRFRQGTRDAARGSHEMARQADSPGPPAHHAPTSPRRRDLVTFGVVVALGSLIGSLRDPGFGTNTASVLTFVATGLALLITVGTSYVSGRSYRARVHVPVAAHLQALPAGLVVAALCVAVSRISHFQPGYLYGVVCGAVFAGSLKRREAGQLTIVASTVTLAVSVASWFAWVPVNHAATHHGAFVGTILLDDVLASIFVAGITGTVISLLPLRFMPGQALYKWHRGAWAATFAIATFGLVEVLLRPSTQAATHPGTIVWTTAVVLFVVFGVGSLAFREYFARHVPADPKHVGLGAAVITTLRAHAGRTETELAQLLSVDVRHLHPTVDRLERAGWLSREKLPEAADANASLRLGSAANDLQESLRVGWFTRHRLILALTRAERRALAGLVKPPVSPVPHARSNARSGKSDRSPTPGS